MENSAARMSGIPACKLLLTSAVYEQYMVKNTAEKLLLLLFLFLEIMEYEETTNFI